MYSTATPTMITTIIKTPTMAGVFEPELSSGAGVVTRFVSFRTAVDSLVTSVPFPLASSVVLSTVGALVRSGGDVMDGDTVVSESVEDSVGFGVVTRDFPEGGTSGGFSEEGGRVVSTSTSVAASVEISVVLSSAVGVTVVDGGVSVASVSGVWVATSTSLGTESFLFFSGLLVVLFSLSKALLSLISFSVLVAAPVILNEIN